MKAVDLPAHGQDLIERAELGFFPIVSSRSVTGFCSDLNIEMTFLRAALIFDKLIGRIVAVITAVENKASGAKNPGQPGRTDQVLLAGQPCSLLRRVQVDVIGGVNAETDAEAGGFLADQPAVSFPILTPLTNSTSRQSRPRFLTWSRRPGS